MPEHWDPPRLRAWIAAKYCEPDQYTRWAGGQLAAGFTVAAYECPGSPGCAIMITADRSTPPGTLPYVDGKVCWPMHLVGVCYPLDAPNVVPLPGLRLSGTGAAG